MLIKSFLIRQRMKYFPVNDLYKVEEQKVRVNDNNLLEENLRFTLSLRYGRREKNEFEIQFNC